MRREHLHKEQHAVRGALHREALYIGSTMHKECYA
jgi:hypothetical protein